MLIDKYLESIICISIQPGIDPRCFYLQIFDQGIRNFWHDIQIMSWNYTLTEVTQACMENSPHEGPFKKDAPSWCQAPFEPEGLLRFGWPFFKGKRRISPNVSFPRKCWFSKCDFIWITMFMVPCFRVEIPRFRIQKPYRAGKVWVRSISTLVLRICKTLHAFC